MKQDELHVIVLKEGQITHNRGGKCALKSELSFGPCGHSQT